MKICETCMHWEERTRDGMKTREGACMAIIPIRRKEPADSCDRWAAKDPDEVISRAPSPYHRRIGKRWIDVYDVLLLWGVANPAAQHAIKKLLRGGSGGKTREQDYEEARKSVVRAIELERGA